MLHGIFLLWLRQLMSLSSPSLWNFCAGVVPKPKTRQKRAGYAIRMPGRTRGPDVRGIAPHAAELAFYLRGCSTEREFPVLLMPTPKKKTKIVFALTREKQKKTPKSTKTSPKNNKKHQKTHTKKKFALTCEKKPLASKKGFPSRQKRNETKKRPLWCSMARGAAGEGGSLIIFLIGPSIFRACVRAMR